MSLPPVNAAELEQTLEADSSTRSRLKLDLFTSYAATYALIRSMLMPLTYLFSGFNPVTQRLLFAPTATAVRSRTSTPTEPLAYAHGRYTRRGPPDEAAVLYAQSNAVAFLATVTATALVYFYAVSFSHLHALSITRTWHAAPFVWLFGIGLLVRLVTEPASAVLQARGRLWLDNLILIGGEIAFVLLATRTLRWGQAAAYVDSWSWFGANNFGTTFLGIADAFLVSGIGIYLARVLVARLLLGFDLRPLLIYRRRTLLTIATGVVTISVGQFADFLYAPANILVINTLISPSDVARYAPALQIDAGLLLLVSAVSTVMLPRAMSAWARGQHESLRRAYVQSTLACLFVLATAALLVGVLIEPILKLWLGAVPSDTPTITRLVLIHTVIGGTAGVGRAVLLGMGRFKAYTLSALIGGIANVGLAVVFVLALKLGLRGIAYATIIAVTARCAIWMPWYILRALRRESAKARVDATGTQ
jgi:O-antigen/teichoic acid export membrane protein